MNSIPPADTITASELFYDVFLLSYINGLQSFLHESESRNRVPGARITSAVAWRNALRLARLALLKARKGSELQMTGKVNEANALADEAMKLVKERYILAPSYAQYLI